MSLYGMIAGKGPSGFGYSSTAEEVTEGLDLRGKTYLVTGCASGLGLETLRVLTLRGARVVGAARSAERAREASKTMQGEVIPLACDLGEPTRVREAVAEIKRQGIRLDGIIANAGIMALPKLELLHGYEAQFFTNHIGHFILVTGLLDQLTERGRVVMVSSDAHRAAPKGGIRFDNLSGEKGYRDWVAYGQSKLANLLFAKELARRLKGSGRTANAIHPGVVSTNLGRHMNPLLSMGWKLITPLIFKNVHEGAATQVFVATHPSVEGVSGEYFSHTQIAQCRAVGNDEALAQKLWEVSEEIVRKVG